MTLKQLQSFMAVIGGINNILITPEYKALCLGQIQHNTSLSTTLHIFNHGGGCILLWVCLSLARIRKFFRIKINEIELSTVKILEENLVQSAFQHWETNSSFSRTIT